ncbi:condensation domain-containing protein, partial [Paenibacillus sp.]|uniref:condensation domain-containing protein n=1 Tax=Paenibacillus sp. TaxID=58172 RepID=UPI00281F3996
MSGIKQEAIHLEEDVIRNLTVLWKEILQLQEVGENDNFFELGGHSLKALELESRIGVMFDVHIPLETIFNHLTIKDLASLIISSQGDKYSPIQSAPERDFYPISWTQKQMLLAGVTSVQHSIMEMRLIYQSIDPYELERAFQKIINRHHMLRTTFEWRDGEFVQLVHDEDHWFKVITIDATDKKRRGERIDDLIAEVDRPYDLSKLPLFRIGLAKYSEEEWLLVISIHHIIADAYSIGLLMNELDCLSQGRLLPKHNLQFTDYCVWQQELKFSPSYEERRNFWFDLFADCVPVLQLPLDHPRSNQMLSKYRIKTVSLDREVVSRLKNIAQTCHVTPSILLTSVLGILMSNYSGQKDFTFGMLSSRRYNGLENCIGMFIRTVPVRLKIDLSSRYTDFLNDVKTACLSSFEHQECDLDDFAEQICRYHEIQPDGNLLYNISINFHTELDHVPERILAEDGEESQEIKALDLSIDVYFPPSEEMYILFQYNAEVFDIETVERWGRHFSNLLNAVMADPMVSLKHISMMTENEKAYLLTGLNDTEVPYPKEKGIPELVERQAILRPDAIAVISGEKQLSYRELHEASMRVARRLRSKGVGEGGLVGVMADRSAGLIAAVLGVLRTGAAYVPIDPGYPAERVAYLLEHAQTPVVLVQQAHLEKLSVESAEEVASGLDTGIIDAHPERQAVSSRETIVIEEIAFGE